MGGTPYLRPPSEEERRRREFEEENDRLQRAAAAPTPGEAAARAANAEQARAATFTGYVPPTRTVTRGDSWNVATAAGAARTEKDGTPQRPAPPPSDFIPRLPTPPWAPASTPIAPGGGVKRPVGTTWMLTELTQRGPGGTMESTPQAEARGIRFRTSGEYQPFMGAGSVPSRSAVANMAGREPYSRQVAALRDLEGPDLKKPGTGWTFSGGYVETGKASPREGTRQLSGVEQAFARRQWLNQREREEQGRESDTAQLEAALAQARQAKAAAELDPMAMARLQAESKYGAEAIRQRANAASRQQAVAQYAALLEQAFKTDDPALRKLLVEGATSLANIIIGQRASTGRDDMLSLLLGQSGLLGGPAGATGEGGT